ncbi:unnamed protein product [Lota lota]
MVPFGEPGWRTLFSCNYTSPAERCVASATLTPLHGAGAAADAPATAAQAGTWPRPGPSAGPQHIITHLVNTAFNNNNSAASDALAACTQALDLSPGGHSISSDAAAAALRTGSESKRVVTTG